jgi:hypothetical protein
MSRTLVVALCAAVLLVVVGESELHLGGSVVWGGVSVLIGGLLLLAEIVMAAAYSDRTE